MLSFILQVLACAYVLDLCRVLYTGIAMLCMYVWYSVLVLHSRMTQACVQACSNWPAA